MRNSVVSRTGSGFPSDVLSEAAADSGAVSAYFYMHDMSWGWALLMIVGWLAFWGVIVGSAVAIWRDRRASARELLDRRLAAGEISVTEYERRRVAMDEGAGMDATAHSKGLT